ncbi:3'-5' exonuclease [Handroanthus impetiginosus]|uniref:3'-5' exonuclease n=1 Tax=Handroanthus impetiginosus TaxID=429701 RepID=A0A2G9I4J6_9LAMI|nr:3'-5' exonuclease [Handroanthus impetiginosus]
MAKLAQKRGMAGSNGKWKEFLKFYDKKFGTSLNDPSRRSIDSLAAFLKTFTQDDFQVIFWLERLTLEHPQYPIDYSFPLDEESEAMKSMEMIAIDCEMVLCKDGTEALVKVFAVDRNLQVTLDKVVNLNKVFADYRTEISRISATDLDGVTHSLKDVQLDYTGVIDTSYVFKYANELATEKPSLSLLCKAILGYELRVSVNPHNCLDHAATVPRHCNGTGTVVSVPAPATVPANHGLDDACAVMKLVLAKLEGRTNDVIAEVKELDMAKLLRHRIPANGPNQDLKSIIAGDFTVKVKSKQKIKDTCAAFAILKNQQEAIEAFENLQGDFEKDICGRVPKLVNFELHSGLAGTLFICKTFPDDCVGQLTKKRSAEDKDETPSVCRKLRTDQISGQLEDSNPCETHLKEIEKLKGELSQRDQEISNLNKIIVALTRKQGL